MKTRQFIYMMGIVGTFHIACFAQTDQKLGGQQISVASNIETGVVAEPLDGRVNSPFIEYGR